VVITGPTPSAKHYSDGEASQLPPLLNINVIIIIIIIIIHFDEYTIKDVLVVIRLVIDEPVCLNDLVVSSQDRTDKER